MKIYYQKENNPGAFYKFYRFLNEAIEENYEKTDDPNLADLILHSTLNNRQEIPTHPADKLVILDWSDFDNIITYNCLGYFKKNWSKRSIVNGVCVKKSPTQLKKKLSSFARNGIAYLFSSRGRKDYFCFMFPKRNRQRRFS